MAMVNWSQHGKGIGKWHVKYGENFAFVNSEAITLSNAICVETRQHQCERDNID
jgi:hypothetical protein